MYIDKRKAEKGKWRIPEKTLFMFTWLGGGIGTIAGMYKFRHKTMKKKSKHNMKGKYDNYSILHVKALKYF